MAHEGSGTCGVDTAKPSQAAGAMPSVFYNNMSWVSESECPDLWLCRVQPGKDVDCSGLVTGVRSASYTGVLPTGGSDRMLCRRDR